MIKVYLKKNEEKRILNGHSWVFANEVQRIEGKDKNGELATVYDYNNNFLGKGYINHLSKILVRIFIRHEDEEPDINFYVERIKKANDKRISIGYTDSYRAVFAEADDLPALIVDKYSDVLSVQFLSLGVDKHKDVILKALIEVFNPKGIYERSDVKVREKEGLPLNKGVLYGNFSPKITFSENGVIMTADLENGQKTGYFLDQKENRLAVRRYVKDKTVLDCFCNSGGFTMNSAIAGAKLVTAVDISQKAIDDVNDIAKLNKFTNVTTVCGDVFEVLRDYKKQGQTFDVIILDPPAFAKTTDNVKNALKGYKDINVTAMKIIKDGGILISSSCSQHITFPMFENMLTESAVESGKRVTCLEIKTQSADHPSLLSNSETLYLKFFVLRVENY